VDDPQREREAVDAAMGQVLYGPTTPHREWLYSMPPPSVVAVARIAANRHDDGYRPIADGLEATVRTDWVEVRKDGLHTKS
jgi:hypothetical protein